MRLKEFASAEEQLALLRLIIDNTWTAISQQAEQERRDKEAKKAKAALKPKRKGNKRLAGIKPVPTVPSPTPAPNPALVKTQPPANPSTKAANPQQLKAQPSANPQQQLTAKQVLSIPTSVSANSSIGAKDAGLAGNSGNLKKDGEGDDRHSKNGISTLKKLPRSF